MIDIEIKSNPLNIKDNEIVFPNFEIMANNLLREYYTILDGYNNGGIAGNFKDIDAQIADRLAEVFNQGYFLGVRHGKARAL